MTPAERAPLPTDPRSLPALGSAFWPIVDQACTELEIGLSAAQRCAIGGHAQLLAAWNREINLTAIRDEAEVARLHVADSLLAVPLLRGMRAAWVGRGRASAHVARAGSAPSILDLGSGGGYPGLPLGVALPASDVALVDSVGKKVRFLSAASAAARACIGAIGESRPDLRAILARAEALAAGPEHRESWDVVTVRAVGSVAEIAELALPLLRIGGVLIAWKRDDGTSLATEIKDAAQVIRAAGGAGARVHAVRLSMLPDHRLVSVHKLSRTPPHFPRPPAERRHA